MIGIQRELDTLRGSIIGDEYIGGVKEKHLFNKVEAYIKELEDELIEHRSNINKKEKNVQ